jgi:Uncharacterized conserved protein (DUF2190)
MTTPLIPDYTVAQGSPAALTFGVASGNTVRAGRVVILTGPMTCQESGGPSAAYLGVAGHAAALPAVPVPVADDKVTVLCGAGVIHETLSQAAIAAGASVTAGTQGRVATGAAGPNTIGVALTATTGADQLVRWLANR